MKTWLVTGCSSGLGKEIAEYLLSKGEKVAVTARNKEKVADYEARYPETAFAVSLDTSERESIENAISAIEERFGGVDVLINNAGHGYRAAVEEGEDADIRELFDTNVLGPVYLMQKVLPGMREKHEGAIVNVTSIAAVRTNIASGYYGASKAALEMISEAGAAELKALGIKVMIVEPGAMKTEFFHGSMKGTSSRIGDYDSVLANKRPEIADQAYNQANDPKKCARLIVDTIESDKYPLRLQLGADAVKAVMSTLAKRIGEAVEWAEICRTTGFDQ
ncbi:MAG: SDR family NAD(P)-dependent oxidoreductase [Lachnospiraceae bacterium]|nr:SDR family NAD(P)-dependent oxidoreductase [Lachnospiraceae bacterium]